ncbi:PPK2 family polyphosphate kinase [Corynebacterium aquatimens]|uniref:PPK2 family polyphosphate:nucleotide phosphotransferase n=1 Tax=Corynebacterium aquatimens TaxID=1190508 RepID=A0A931E1M1_9CORY|nr:PPK2 family polyphosphate kinase [Corynebacterium aquatimens]MBG6121691.1 PPK2 family polyphosphate:nucleotide phosphotransferase [Corynebacterium aquatimens]WJY65770.1 Polyphosphate kinase 2 (PPK2) [Corynebacterium aquatimens]
MAKVTIEEAKKLRVTPDFRIADVDPSSTPGVKPGEVDKAFNDFDEEIADLQECLYANGRAGNENAGSLLLVLQGTDTSGKGGIIRHVVGDAMDPQGVRIKAFGKPTEEERKHDFLWRFEPHLPAPGMVSVFDRSHYEDVLVQRVKQMAPPEEIERRYGAIVEFENELAARGTKIIKVMPHISKEFQKENLRKRIEREDKHWKYNPGDIDDRKLWDEFQEAYEIAMTRTSTDVAPWYCVPSDDKTYCRTVVKSLIVDALRSLNLEWPAPDFDPAVELARLEES